MEAKSFYSKRKVIVPVRSIPNLEVSEESDLSSVRDESDFVLDLILCQIQKKNLMFWNLTQK